MRNYTKLYRYTLIVSFLPSFGKQCQQRKEISPSLRGAASNFVRDRRGNPEKGWNIANWIASHTKRLPLFTLDSARNDGTKSLKSLSC